MYETYQMLTKKFEPKIKSESVCEKEYFLEYAEGDAIISNIKKFTIMIRYDFSELSGRVNKSIKQERVRNLQLILP